MAYQIGGRHVAGGTEAGMLLEALLDNGWNYHHTQSEHVARELESAAAAGVAPALLARFLDFSTHVIGEHLGDWERALALGQRVLDGHAPARDTAKAWERLYVAAVLAGEVIGAAQIELSCLKVAGDPIASLLSMRLLLANALVGAKRNDEGARICRSAIDFAQRIAGAADLDRIIAATSNNLAWTLYEMSSRTADDDDLMQLAADASSTFWGRCGTWINEERALHLKSVVALAVGRIEDALTFAERALAVIAANGDRPLDSARLQLARAAALAARGDAEGRMAALANADAAAGQLASNDLRQQFAVERAASVAAWAASAVDP
jgi:hypothetical protein